MFEAVLSSPCMTPLCLAFSFVHVPAPHSISPIYNRIMPAPATNATPRYTAVCSMPNALGEENPGTPALLELLLPLELDPPLDPPVAVGADVTVPWPFCPACEINATQLPVG